MKRTTFCAAFLLMLGATVAEAGVINVNVAAPAGRGPNGNVTLDGTNQVGFTPIDPQGTVWNDVDGTITNADLAPSLGGSSGIGVARTSTGGNNNAGFTFSQPNGLNAGVADILDNYLAANHTFGGSVLQGPIEFEFSGLDTLATYSFHFVAVGDSVGQGATLDLDGNVGTSTGASPTGPLTAGDNVISFVDITPSASTITLELTTGAGNTSFAALSGFQISSDAIVPEPSSLALAAFGFAFAFKRRR